MIKKSGIIKDIDYSHGTIFFEDKQTYSCTWSGMFKGSIGSFIVAEGPNEDSFNDASSYEPGSAKLFLECKAKEESISNKCVSCSVVAVLLYICLI